MESQRELDEDQRPFAGRAADLERSAQGLGPVAEADQARAAGRIGAARAVVADRQVQAAVSLSAATRITEARACLVALVSASETT